MRLYHSELRAAERRQLGHLEDEKLDELIDKAHTSFDRAAQTKALADVHSYIVDQAYWVFIVHDLNPRAMSPKVKGFVQAQSWFQDLTPSIDSMAHQSAQRATRTRRPMLPSTAAAAPPDLPGAGRLRRVAAGLRAGPSRAGRSVSAIVPPEAPKEVVDKLKAYYGFDKPLQVQYVRWLARHLTGDFGISIGTSRPVAQEVGSAFGNTIMLAIAAGGARLRAGRHPRHRRGLRQVAHRRPAGHRDRDGRRQPAALLAGIVLVIIFAVDLSVLPAMGMGPENATGWRFDWPHHQAPDPAGHHPVADPAGRHQPHRARDDQEILSQEFVRRCTPRA